MARSARIPALLMLFAACAVPGIARPADQSDAVDAPKLARIRPGNARLTALVGNATARSVTFRTLVTSIEQTDGVVLIDEGRCPRGVAACLTWNVTLAGGYRLLFVLIRMDRPDDEIMASIGHELQHALEVLSNPLLTSTAAIQLFYMPPVSPESPRAIETRAAEEAGYAILREVRRIHSRDGT